MQSYNWYWSTPDLKKATLLAPGLPPSGALICVRTTPPRLILAVSLGQPTGTIDKDGPGLPCWHSFRGLPFHQGWSKAVWVYLWFDESLEELLVLRHQDLMAPGHVRWPPERFPSGQSELTDTGCFTLSQPWRVILSRKQTVFLPQVQFLIRYLIHSPPLRVWEILGKWSWMRRGYVCTARSQICAHVKDPISATAGGMVTQKYCIH